MEKAILNFINKVGLDKKITFYNKNEFIIKNGQLIDKSIKDDMNLYYIVSGSVSVIEGNKSIKEFGKGEVFGLFEVAYFLKNGIFRKMGNWSIVANNNLELIIIEKEHILKITSELKKIIIKKALNNHSPKPITRLPVLDVFAQRNKIEIQNNTILIFHSHLLESTYDLLKHLVHLFGYDNTFILEKPYSTIDSVYKKIVQMGPHMYSVNIDGKMPYEFSIKRNIDFLWKTVVEHVNNKNIKKIIILSDGADVVLDIPWNELPGIDVVSVEQTQRGLSRIKDSKRIIPHTVSVATSKIKKKYESPYIAKAVIDKISDINILSPEKKVGIIGVGSIGVEIIKFLEKSSIEYIYYDISQQEDIKNRLNSLEKIFIESDIVIGTTGKDSSRGVFIDRIKGKRILISASSSNVEFSYFFDLAKKYANNFENVNLNIRDDLNLLILNGGYPINFDREKEWEKMRDIQLTRSILYAGIIQALTLEKILNNRIDSLKNKYQDEILNLWKDNNIKNIK